MGEAPLGQLGDRRGPAGVDEPPELRLGEREPGQPSDLLVDRWPRSVHGVLVEPGTGKVRVRRPGEEPIELEPGAARWLAEQPCAPADVREVLEDAAAEAERQAQVLLELMEAKA